LVNSNSKNGSLVYSTAIGDLRKKGLSGSEKKDDPAKGATPLLVSLDTKGRRGKPVTMVANIAHNPQVIDDLARKLKLACGAGGTVEGRAILIQGDHRQKIAAKLVELGFKVKVR